MLPLHPGMELDVREHAFLLPGLADGSTVGTVALYEDGARYEWREAKTVVEPDSFSLSTDERVQYARPSIDVLLESAAESYRERCVGVVLTGANADGAGGLARVAELGGAAIVEDAAEAARAEMPRAPLDAVPTARVAATTEIGPLLVELCGLARVHAQWSR